MQCSSVACSRHRPRALLHLGVAKVTYLQPGSCLPIQQGVLQLQVSVTDTLYTQDEFSDPSSAAVVPPQAEGLVAYTLYAWQQAEHEMQGQQQPKC